MEQVTLQGMVIKEARDKLFDYLNVLDEAPRTRKVSLRHRGFSRIPPEVV